MNYLCQPAPLGSEQVSWWVHALGVPAGWGYALPHRATWIIAAVRSTPDRSAASEAAGGFRRHEQAVLDEDFAELLRWRGRMPADRSSRRPSTGKGFVHKVLRCVLVADTDRYGAEACIPGLPVKLREIRLMVSHTYSLGVAGAAP